MAVFARFLAINNMRYRIIYYSLYPLENEEALDADENIRFFQFVLWVFGKEVQNVVWLIRDNCSLK